MSTELDALVAYIRALANAIKYIRNNDLPVPFCLVHKHASLTQMFTFLRAAEVGDCESFKDKTLSAHVLLLAMYHAISHGQYEVGNMLLFAMTRP